MPSVSDKSLTQYIQHMYAKILYIIGEWDLMIPLLRSLTPLHPATAQFSCTAPQADALSHDDTLLSQSSIQRLLLLDSSCSSDLSLTYQIQQFAQLHLPQYLKDRRHNWTQSLSNKSTKHSRQTTQNTAPHNKRLSLRISLPHNHIDPLAALARDLFMIYKKRFDKSQDLNNCPVTLNLQHLTNSRVTLDQLDTNVSQWIQRIPPCTYNQSACLDAHDFDSLPAKRKRNTAFGTGVDDESPPSKFPKHFTLDVRNLNSLDGLKDVFVETRSRQISSRSEPITNEQDQKIDCVALTFPSLTGPLGGASPKTICVKTPVQILSDASSASDDSTNSSNFSTIDDVLSFSEQVNRGASGLLDVMHSFVECVFSQHMDKKWSSRLIHYVRRMARHLFQRHAYTFSSFTSLHCAELMLDQYNPSSDKDTVGFKILAHKFLSECSLADTSPTEKCRIFFAFGTVVSRSNPQNGIKFFQKCLDCMTASDIEQFNIPHVSQRREMSVASLSSVISDMNQEVELYRAEDLILRKKHREGLLILERYISVSTTRHITLLVRDLMWIAALSMDTTEIAELEIAPSLFHFLFTTTELPVLSNYSSARLIFKRLWSILEKSTLQFSSTERSEVMKRLMQMIQGALEDFNLSRSTQFLKLAELITYAVMSLRKIGTFCGETTLQKCHSNYRSIFLLQSMLVTQLSIPRNSSFFDTLIREYYAIFNECNNPLKEATQDCDQWAALKERVTFGAAVCFYALFGIILVDPQDGRFVRWKQLVDVRCASGAVLPLNQSFAKMAFVLIEQNAHKQVEYDSDNDHLLNIYGVLSVLFPYIFTFDSPFERNVAEIETNDWPWNSTANVEKVPQSHLEHIIPEESDRNLLSSFNYVMAKAQLMYADNGPEEEQFARYSEALNIIRRALGLSPKDSSMWLLLGELYYALVCLHLDNKMKTNDIIIVQGFRSNLLLSEDNVSVDADLEQCVLRSLRCYFISLNLNPRTFEASCSIPKVLNKLLRRKVAVSGLGDLRQIFELAVKYAHEASVLIQEQHCRHRYMVLFLDALIHSWDVSTYTAEYQNLIPRFQQASSACQSYLDTVQDTFEKEAVKRDLSEILCRWCQMFIHLWSHFTGASKDQLPIFVAFALKHVYRYIPQQELEEAPNVGYLQGYSIPSTYAEIVSLNQQHLSTLDNSLIMLCNLLYHGFFQALRLNPYNYLAVHQMSILIDLRSSPWESVPVAQKVAWSLFKQKMTGTTRRPEFFELNVKDAEYQRKILSTMVRRLQSTLDMRVLSMILAGIRRSYLSLGPFVMDLYIKGIGLLITYVKKQLQELSKSNKNKKKLPTKDKDQIFRWISMAYVYIHDPEVEQYAPSDGTRERVLKESQQMLSTFVKDQTISLSLEKDVDNSKVVTDFQNKKGLNLTRRKRTISRRASSKSAKILSTNIHVVQLKSLEERTREAENELHVENEAFLQEQEALLEEEEGEEDEELFEEEGETDEEELIRMEDDEDEEEDEAGVDEEDEEDEEDIEDSDSEEMDLAEAKRRRLERYMNLG
eukprot:CAMPEP_0117437808 /NCGR_PEP_ID=MMETSP0759-20121206/1722_1 /TAXON_ID=63605 /ORGANISM="Percolomonas cosmopolitus, Strain WS" /LENGTH=1531 /DNA_ID=CAMNT_0005229467 /DNA_START=744 /DNA_END=5339 /DNA_ORIENTATION=-